MSMTPLLFMVLLAVTDARIWEGEPATITEFPSTAALFVVEDDGGIGKCGATIISDTWVLTAAHCVDGRRESSVTVKVGTDDINSEVNHKVSSIIMHEEYLDLSVEYITYDLQYDIAVVEVEVPFDLNGDTIQAARLPLQDEVFPPGIHVTAVGWGRTRDYKKNDFLQKLNMEIITARECGKYYFIVSIDRHVCAIDQREGNRLCDGDSGSPLYFEGKVIAIMSFGKDCSWTKVPDVFTNVAYFRDWIKHKTGI